MRWVLLGGGAFCQILAVLAYLLFCRRGFFFFRPAKPGATPSVNPAPGALPRLTMPLAGEGGVNFAWRDFLKPPSVFLLLAVCLLALGTACVLFFALIDSDPVLLGTQIFIALGLFLIFCFFRV